MKNTALIFLIVILMSSCSPFKIAGVPKNSSMIVIKNNHSAEENLLLVKKALAEKGIEIRSQDKDILQLKTGITPVSKLGYSAYYIIYCKTNQIQINGLYNTGDKVITSGVTINNDPFQKIYYTKWGGNGYAFKAMNDLAKSLGENLEYK